MNFIIYAITYPLAWLLSILPMPILYIISDFFYLIVYYIVGYRKKVVINNLRMAFPAKSDKEITKLSKAFFKHFIDLMFESIKMFSISEKEMLKRYKSINVELVNNLAKKGKSIILVGAHKGNWEWSSSLPLVIDIPVYAAYTKLANPYFEKRIKKTRTQFNIGGIKSTEIVKKIHQKESNKEQAAYLLLSDQSPMLHKAHYWQKFFNIKVPVHTGAEMLAKRYDFAVVNYSARKVRRGYYETEFTLITETPKDLGSFEITDKYLSITEDSIKDQPAYYLWSHKRFKHKDRYDEWLATRKK